MYRYKQLSPIDVADLKDLLRVFGEAFNDPGTYLDHVPRDEYLKSLLEQDHFIALAAFDGQSVVGGLTAYVLEKFEQERKEIYIYDLAVIDRYRRQGIATALISLLGSIGKKIGAYVIFVQADKIDTPAIKLYESLGKPEDVYNFDIDVT